MTLWVCLLHTKTFLFYIVFLTMKRDVAFFFEKLNFIWTPFFQNSFFQNRLAHPHTNFELDRTSRFREKWLFCLKLTIFNKVNCVNYLDIGGCERSPDGANRFGILFTTERWYFYGSIFFLSWKNDHFFPKKVTKRYFKKGPFSSKLRDFSYSLL